MKKLAYLTLSILCLVALPSFSVAQSFTDNFSGATLGVDTGSFTDTAVGTDNWVVVPSGTASVAVVSDASTFLPNESVNIGYDPGSSSNEAGISLNLADVGITQGTYELSMDIRAGQASDTIAYNLSDTSYFISPTYIPLDNLNYTDEQFQATVTVGPNSHLTILTTDSNATPGSSTNVYVSGISLQPVPEPAPIGLLVAGGVFGLLMIKKRMR